MDAPASGPPPGISPEAIQHLINAAANSRGSALTGLPPLPAAAEFAAPASFQLQQLLALNPDALSILTGALGNDAHLAQAQAMSAPPGAGASAAARSGEAGGRAGGSYASRHQQAEARRRSRINERLDALRRIVPHTERANTAAFLEDVIAHVGALQRRILELELRLGLPPSLAPALPPALGGGGSGSGGAGATAAATAADGSAAMYAAILQQAASALGVGLAADAEAAPAAAAAVGAGAPAAAPAGGVAESPDAGDDAGAPVAKRAREAS
jgi:hypothetical protein